MLLTEKGFFSPSKENAEKKLPSLLTFHEQSFSRCHPKETTITQNQLITQSLGNPGGKQTNTKKKEEKKEKRSEQNIKSNQADGFFSKTNQTHNAHG